MLTFSRISLISFTMHIGSHALVRWGPTLTTFFFIFFLFGLMGERGSKYNLKRAIMGPPVKRH